MPRSREAVEAEILAALNRPVREPGVTQPPSGSTAPARPRFDPLTAPLSILESSHDHPVEEVEDPEVVVTEKDLPQDAPPPGAAGSDTHADSRVHADSGVVDVFAPLREKLAPDVDRTSAHDEDETQPSPKPPMEQHDLASTLETDNRDAVVLGAIEARLSARPDVTEPPTPPVHHPEPEAATDAAPSADAGLDIVASPPQETDPEPAATLAVPSAEPSASRIELTPRRATQRLFGVLMLASFVGVCLTGWTAWQERTTTTIATTACLGVLTLILRAAHSSATPPHMVVENGVLDITRHQTHHMFDLSSTSTPIEVVGAPGRRNWRVLFLRRSMQPFVIDASMVDPHEFTEVLELFRPGPT